MRLKRMIKTKNMKTVIVIDYDELSREVSSIRRGKQQAAQNSEGFNLGFFMIPFMNRENVSLCDDNGE